MLAYLAELRRLNRSVRLIFLASAAIGFTVYGGIYSVLLNLFLLRLGYGPEFIGLVNGAGLLGLAATAIPSGMLGRRIGHAVAVRSGLVLAGVCLGMLPLAAVLPVSFRPAWLLATFALGMPGTASFYVNIHPIIMGAIRPEQRNLAYSVLSSLWPLAGFAGAMIAGFLPGLFGLVLGSDPSDAAPYGYPLVLAALTLGLTAAVLLGVRDSGTQVAVVEPGRTNAGLAYALFAAVALIVFLRGTGEGTARTFVNVYMDERLHIATPQIGALLSVGQLLTGAAVLMMPLLSRRFGNVKTAVGASITVALGLLPLAVPHWLATAAGFTFILAAASVAGSAFSVYVLSMIPNAHRAVLSGFSNTGWALSQSMTAIGGGYLVAAFGYPALFLTASALAMASALLTVAGFAGRSARWRSP